MDLKNRFLQVQDLIKGYDKPTIGVLQEKTLHKIIKNLYEEDKNFQEVKVGPYYADICRDNKIIEVQTKQFNRLREKLDYYLKENYDINIIYPVFNSKTLYYMDSFGEVEGPKKSPKKLKIPEIFYELYKIKSYLNNPNIKITILIFDIDEFRIKGKSRSGRVCYDRRPRALVDYFTLDSISSYIKLLPNDLREEFTSLDLKNIYKCDLKYVNYMLNCLKFIGAVEVVRKDGHKYIYKVKQA